MNCTLSKFFFAMQDLQTVLNRTCLIKIINFLNMLTALEEKYYAIFFNGITIL